MTSHLKSIIIVMQIEFRNAINKMQYQMHSGNSIIQSKEVLLFPSTSFLQSKLHNRGASEIIISQGQGVLDEHSLQQEGERKGQLKICNYRHSRICREVV